MKPPQPRKTILKRFFQSQPEIIYVTVKIRAPKYFFLRAAVFIQDVIKLAGCDVPQLNINSLIAVLYDNFLEKIRRGIDLHQYLMTLTHRYRQFVSSLELSPKSDQHWVLSEKSVANSQDMAALNFKLKEDYALRGEVFLYDMREIDPDFSMTLDQLISLLFMEFVEAIRTGNIEEIMNHVLDYFSEMEEEF